jgi:hypothetical protein
MLSFSISYWDLVKFHYFADTTEREDKGWKQAQREGEEHVVLVNGLGLTLHVSVKLCKFILYCVKQCKYTCKNKYIYTILHGYVKQCIYF